MNEIFAKKAMGVEEKIMDSTKKDFERDKMDFMKKMEYGKMKVTDNLKMDKFFKSSPSSSSFKNPVNKITKHKDFNVQQFIGGAGKMKSNNGFDVHKFIDGTGKIKNNSFDVHKFIGGQGQIKNMGIKNLNI